MNPMRLSEHLLELRRKRGVTQDELAAFLNVTKASVSKWENRQSFPDIMLLPQIASYFDISIDDLLGYEPQMSKEQIKKCYHDLASDFAVLPFEEVMQKSKALVKEYYSCYAFLLQICVLWLNHCMLAKEPARQTEIMNDIVGVCDHIRVGCKDVGTCSDALALKAMAELQLSKPQEVIEALEEELNPNRLTRQADMLLIQAFQMTGDIKKANQYSQISMFSNLLALVGGASQYLSLHMQDPKLCEETIRRTEKLIDIFHLESLHPNTAAVFAYQAAICFCMQQKNDEAMERLHKFISISLSLIENGLTLHGDDYFNALDEWFERFDLGAEAPRDKKLIFSSIVQAVENPVFAPLSQMEAYIRMRKTVKERGVYYESN